MPTGEDTDAENPEKNMMPLSPNDVNMNSDDPSVMKKEKK